MPGACAHHFDKPDLGTGSVRKPPPDPEETISILDYFRFCELGTVSPDYPYVDILHHDAAPWPDRMHYERTGDMIKAGVNLVKKLDGTSQQKAFSCLLGYTSHVVTDVTTHPLVELKAGNKGKHMICEMNQDADIFQRMNLGEIGGLFSFLKLTCPAVSFIT